MTLAAIPAAAARAFTLAEHEAVTEWAATLPRRVRHRVALDHEAAEEALEVGRDLTLPAAILHPALGGGAFAVTWADGSGCEVETLAAGLALVAEEVA